jgi:hypothetical protein
MTKTTGRYCRREEYNPEAQHNIASWRVISAILSAYGGGNFNDLSAAVSQHADPNGGDGEAFVNYCIRRGWLKPA